MLANKQPTNKSSYLKNVRVRMYTKYRAKIEENFYAFYLKKKLCKMRNERFLVEIKILYYVEVKKCLHAFRLSGV